MKTTNNRYCHNCGIEFEPHTANQIYCSQECYQRVHPQKPIEKRNCSWCHAIFTSYKNNSSVTRQRFCSTDCRNAFYTMRQHIFNKWFFERVKEREQLERLERLGCDYKLGE